MELSLSLEAAHQYPICIPLLPHSCHMPCPSHPPLLDDHSDYIWRRVQVHCYIRIRRFLKFEECGHLYCNAVYFTESPLLQRDTSLCLQGGRVGQARNQQKFTLLLLVSCLARSLTLKMEAVYLSKMSGCRGTTQCYTSEGPTFDSHHHGNLRSLKFTFRE